MNNEMERFIRNPIIRQLMLPSLNQSTFIRVINNLDDGINDVITDSMDRDEKKTPMCKDFRSNLTIRKISKKDLDEEISCAICQDLFSNNEERISLSLMRVDYLNELLFQQILFSRQIDYIHFLL